MDVYWRVFHLDPVRADVAMDTSWREKNWTSIWRNWKRREENKWDFSRQSCQIVFFLQHVLPLFPANTIFIHFRWKVSILFSHNCDSIKECSRKMAMTSPHSDSLFLVDLGSVIVPIFMPSRLFLVLLWWSYTFWTPVGKRFCKIVSVINWLIDCLFNHFSQKRL